MAYYDAFIAEWATFTGTTAQKLVSVNAATVVHPVPALVTSTQLLNAIVAADFSGLGVNGLSQLQIVVTTPMVNISVGSQIRAILSTLFSGKTTTLANITALAAPFDNAVIPWWQANGYSRPFDMGDVAAAGVS